jgi:peptidoglycan/LPS O-acetylase OafA/YrhL
MQKNLTIQGFRGFLALSVVIFHAYKGLVDENLLNPVNGLLGTIDYVGWVSVNLFFVISGYLILQSLLRHKNIKKFFIDRVLRIYPVFTVIHLIVFAVGPVINYKWFDGITPSEYLVHFISNFLLLPGLFPSLPEAQIVAWSLSYEFLFYILMVAYFYVYTEKKSVYKFPIFILSVISTVLFMAFHPRSLFFLVGILLFILEKKMRAIYKYTKLLDGVLLLSLIYLTCKYVDLWVSLILTFLLFIPILNEKGLLSKILRTRQFNYLGDISYSLYLWHTFVMFPLKIITAKVAVYIHNDFVLFLFFLSISLILSLVVSHYSYLFVEVKFTKYVKDIIYKSKYPLNQMVGSRQSIQ